MAEIEWKHLSPKERVLECVGHVGLGELLVHVLKMAQPTRWDGYELAHFLHPTLPDGSALALKMEQWLHKFSQTYELPEDDLRRAAAYYWLWKSSRSEDGVGALFRLLYLDSLNWRFPAAFDGNKPAIEWVRSEPRFRYVAQEAWRGLCGVMSPSDRLFCGRTGTAAQYGKLCGETKREFWERDFAKAEKTPELVLALSFHANGFAAYGTHGADEAGRAKFLCGLVDGATSPLVKVPDDDWEARAVFLVLALWIHFGGKRSGEDTLEERIFAVLYLRFYRSGVDKYFGRGSLRKIWDAIPFAEKEKAAARCRRLLAETWTEAVKKWPTSVPSGCPEIEIDAEGDSGYGMALSEAVKTGDKDLADKLIGEHLPSAGQCRDMLLWSALESPETFGWLEGRIGGKVAIEKASSPTDSERSTVRDGVAGKKAAEVVAAFGRLEKLYSEPALADLRKACASTVYEHVVFGVGEDADDELDELDELRDAGFDPNGSHSGGGYDATRPPVDEAVRWANLDLVEWFLDAGVNLNCGGQNDTVVGHAVRNRLNFVLKALLDAGADPNAASPEGRRPLELAALLDNEGAMWLLLAAGADPALVPDGESEGSEKWGKVLDVHAKVRSGEKPPVWCVNLIPREMIDWHYDEKGEWRMDPPDEDGFEGVRDYAERRPEYVFEVMECGKLKNWVGIHDKAFAQGLSGGAYENMAKGGTAVRVEEDDDPPGGGNDDEEEDCETE